MRFLSFQGQLSFWLLWITSFIWKLCHHLVHLSPHIIDEGMCPPPQAEEPVGSTGDLLLGRQEFSTSFVSFNLQTTHSCVLSTLPHVSLKRLRWKVPVLLPADGQQGNSAVTAFVTQLLPFSVTNQESSGTPVSRDPALDSLISPFWVLRVFVLANCPSNLRTLNVEMQQFWLRWKQRAGMLQTGFVAMSTHVHERLNCPDGSEGRRRCGGEQR